MNNKIYKDKYKIQETIYNQQLSASKIFLAIDIDNNLNVAIKRVKKDRLTQSFMHELAKNEIVLQYSLSRLSNNIVKVPAYFEDEEYFTTIMEYSEEPCYFEDLLENV